MFKKCVAFTTIVLTLIGCKEKANPVTPSSLPYPPNLDSFQSWYLMPPPAYQRNVDASPASASSDTVKSWSRAQLHWYNPPQGLGTPVVEIFPGTVTPPGEETLYPLTLEYMPRSRGMYNYSMNLQRTLLSSPATNWAGITQELPGRPRDLGKEGVHSMKLWVKVIKGDINGNGKLMIDLGRFSEDVLPNHRLNSEDIIPTANNPNGIPRGVADELNDLGLDMLSDDEEMAVYGDFVDSNKAMFPEIITDPSGDDYFYHSGTADFSRFNGLEGNRNIRRIPDTEDLNQDNVVEVRNDYVEYELDLDTTSQNFQRSGVGANGWYQYRIALTGYTSVIGNPDLTRVDGIRIWFTGFSKDLTIKVLFFYFDDPAGGSQYRYY